MINSVICTTVLFAAVLLFNCSKPSDWQVFNKKNTPLKNEWIRQLVLDNGELAWVGTYGDGAYHIAHGKWQKVSAIPEHEYILRMKRNGAALWVGTGRTGLYSFSDAVWNRWDTASGLADNNCWDLLALSRDSVIAGSRYRGLSIIAAKVTALMPGPDAQITLLERDSSHRLWVGTARSGLYGVLNLDTVYLNTRTGLSGNYVRALVCDSLPRWVGTWDGGLDFFENGKWRNIPIIKRPVVVLTLDSTGSLWVGTWGNGVYRQTGKAWENINSSNSGLPDNQVIDIKFGNCGKVFFATSKGIALHSF